MPFPVPKKVDKEWSAQDYEELCHYIKHKVRSHDSRLDNFRSQQLPEYSRIYKGIPKEENISYPWPGAANLVIQLVGTFTDELLSRVIGGIYLYDPLWNVELSGEVQNQDAEEMKSVLQRFLMDEAYDPAALDLYRAETAFYTSAIKYGTGWIGFPWEYSIEQNYVHLGGGIDKEPLRHEFKKYTKKDSPSPKLIPLNKIGVDPRIAKLDKQEFFFEIETLDYWGVKNLPAYDANIEDGENLKKVLEQPDRLEPDELTKAALDAQQIDSGLGEKADAEWDIYKCYITYKKGNDTYSILAKYHKKSRTVLYAIFNIYPKNIFPVEDVKLSYDEEQYFGYGYVQMLRNYQKELSQNNNWRTNNRNMAMLQMLRVDPQSQLQSILQVFPGCMLPAKEGEVEVLKIGADVGYNDGPDQFISAMAKERAGVDPAIGGTGGGIVNPKRGIYSAGGTSMMLMQQNNRNNLRMSDMRGAHVRIAIKLMEMYTSFGIGDKLKKYGERAETLKRSFAGFKDGTVGFRLRQVTSSNNRELERQNDILLAGALSRFYQESAQMIQAMVQAQKDMPQLSEFYNRVLLANSALYQRILRNFNHDDVLRLLPKPPQLPSKTGGQGESGGTGPQAPGIQGAIPTGAIQGFGGIPSGAGEGIL